MFFKRELKQLIMHPAASFNFFFNTTPQSVKFFVVAFNVANLIRGVHWHLNEYSY